jgi:hypothetical protein
MTKFFLIFLIACSTTYATPELTASQRFDKVKLELDAAFARDEPFATVVRLVERTYDRWFTPAFQARLLKRNEPADLGAFFDAAHFVAEFTLKPTHARQALAAYDALAKLHRVTPEQHANAQSVLIKTRLLDPRPGFDLPVVHDTSNNRVPTELVVSDGQVTRRWLSLANAQVIAVVAPGCHFAQRAMKDVAADRDLSQLFSRVHWLVPQEAIGDFADVKTPYTIAYDRNEFPMIDTWESPTFYFMVDGVVKRNIVGWPRNGGNLGALQEAALALDMIEIEQRWSRVESP